MLVDLQRRRQALYQLCENRVKAEQIRALVADIELRQSAILPPDFCAWKDWALAEAISLDPLHQPIEQVLILP